MEKPLPLPSGPGARETDALGARRHLEQSPAGDVTAAAAELAREFEAMLLLQMVRQMRRPMWVEPDEGLGADTMLDTIDLEFARALSRQSGIGLADTLATAMTKRQSTAVTGGTEPIAQPDPAPSDPSSGTATGEMEGRALGIPAAQSGHADRDGSREATMTSGFGWRRDPLAADVRFHAGVDVKAAYGSHVRAAASGRVVFAGRRGGYGNVVIVEHQDGYQTRYAHLSSLQVQPGDEVGEGQAVGRVGATGRATGPHLHFEVSRNGRPVDPASTPWRPSVKAAAAAADLPQGDV